MSDFYVGQQHIYTKYRLENFNFADYNIVTMPDWKDHLGRTSYFLSVGYSWSIISLNKIFNVTKLD